MHDSLFWLVATGLLTSVLWIPYVLNRMAIKGMLGAMANPADDDPVPPPWAKRAKAAHQVAIENLPIFAALVLTTHALGLEGEFFASAARVYFFGMLGHYVVYTLGIPVLRTGLFLVAGFGVEVVWGLRLFSLM